MPIFAGETNVPDFSTCKYNHFRRQMNILDIIILICLIPALVQGIRKGFIAQVIAIISLIAGVWLSFKFASAVSEWIGTYIQAGEQVLKITSFALILVAVILALGALGKILEATIKLVTLGWLNRLLGAVFSLLKCALILGLVIMAFDSLNNTFGFLSEEKTAGSTLYLPLKDIAHKIFPYLKEMFFWNS